MKQYLFVVFTTILCLVSSTSTNNNDSKIDKQQVFFGGPNKNNQKYIEWTSNVGNNKYPHFTWMPSETNNDHGVAVHWKIQDDSLYLAVIAKAKGWVGFGLADAGGMQGADIMYYERETDTVTDSHVLDIRYPMKDAHQDWTLIESTVLEDVDNDDVFLVVEVKRLLDTGDLQDRVLFDDSDPAVPAARVIAAWGDSTMISAHGVNRSRSAIRFFADELLGDNEELLFAEKMEANAEGSFEIRSGNYVIATEETEYGYFCFSREQLAQENDLDPNDIPTVYAIGFEPIVDQPLYVHHFIIYGSKFANDGIAENGRSCEDGDFYELAYVWAPGEGPLALPDNVGAPMFGNEFGNFQSYQLEIHYNNPGLVPNVVDNSGIKIYYTTQPRQLTMGVLLLGDFGLQLFGRRVGVDNNDYAKHVFDCPSSCSEAVFNFANSDQEITVLREYLHMHKTGVRVLNEQMNADGEVTRSGIVDFWSFDQNGNQAIRQEPFTIQQGDSFRTTCYYDTTTETEFGLSSSQEMCMAFLFYYPRIEVFGTPWSCAYSLFDNSDCSADWNRDGFDDMEELDRVFGTQNLQPANPPLPPTDVGNPTSPPVMAPTTPTVAPVVNAPTSSAATISNFQYRQWSMIMGFLMIVMICLIGSMA